MTPLELRVEIMRATGINEDEVDRLKTIKKQVDAGVRSEWYVEEEQRKEKRVRWQNLESDFRSRTSAIKDPFTHQEVQTVVFLRMQEDENNPTRILSGTIPLSIVGNDINRLTRNLPSYGERDLLRGNADENGTVFSAQQEANLVRMKERVRNHQIQLRRSEGR